MSLWSHIGYMQKAYPNLRVISNTDFQRLTQEQRTSAIFFLVTDRQYKSLLAVDELNSWVVSTYRPIKSEVAGLKRIFKGIRMTFEELRIGMGCGRNSTDVYDADLFWCGISHTCGGVYQFAVPIVLFIASLGIYKST